MHRAHNAAIRDWGGLAASRARGEREGRGAVRRRECRWGACRLDLGMGGGARWGRSRGAGAGDGAERGGRALLRAGAWTEGARSARNCLRRAKGRRGAAKMAAAGQRLGRAGSQSASWMARSAVVAIKEGLAGSLARWSHVERAGGSAVQG